MDKSLIDDGYNLIDFLIVMNRVVQDSKDIDDKKRFTTLKIIAEYKMRCLDGINSKCQVYCFISEILKILKV